MFHCNFCVHVCIVCRFAFLGIIIIIVMVYWFTELLRGTKLLFSKIHQCIWDSISDMWRDYPNKAIFTAYFTVFCHGMYVIKQPSKHVFYLPMIVGADKINSSWNKKLTMRGFIIFRQSSSLDECLLNVPWEVHATT